MTCGKVVDGKFGVQLLCRLLNNVLKTEKMPSERKISILVPMFTRKGDIKEYNNYRGIKLLSHTFKLWERVTNKKLTECTSIHESQLGFMPGRSTTDANFGLRQTVEKHREGQKDINLVFINLEKTYDHMCTEEVWRCAREQHVLEKYIRVIQDMYRECEKGAGEISTSGRMFCCICLASK